MGTYLITQATGEQSRYIIKHLLANGAKVHALVRSLEKAQSHPILQQDGVTLFQGESHNEGDVFQAAQGCQGVFLNTFPIPGLEAQQAQAIVQGSRKAGIQGIVVSTVFGAGTPSLWDNEILTQDPSLGIYYNSKANLEEIVRKAGFKTYTILRPGFIHFDYFLGHVEFNYPDLPKTGELVHTLNDEARLPQTDADDIGKYGAAALQAGEKFNSAEIELTMENLTISEVRNILQRVSGRQVRVRRRTTAEVQDAASAVFVQKFQIWAGNVDFARVIEAGEAAQAKYGISMTPLEEALEREKGRLLACIPA